MGFFANEGEFSTYKPTPAGVYPCKLKSVEPTEGRSYDDPNVMVKQFKWVFEGVGEDACDEETGAPYRWTKYTKTNYGDSRAGFTILLNNLLGIDENMDEQVYRALDIEDLKQFRYQISVSVSRKPDGSKKNDIDWIRRAQTRATSIAQAAREKAGVPARAPQPKDTEFDDPFEDELPAAPQRPPARRVNTFHADDPGEVGG